MGAETATLYLVLVAATRPMPRLSPAVGIAAGVGMEAKYTIATLLAALLVGFALTDQRRLLRTRGPWVAAAIAFALVLPNLGWEYQHGWPSVSFASSQHAQILMDTAGNCTLYDQGSTNGTFVNGVRVSQYALTHGVAIRVGSTELRFLAQ